MDILTFVSFTDGVASGATSRVPIEGSVSQHILRRHQLLLFPLRLFLTLNFCLQAQFFFLPQSLSLFLTLPLVFLLPCLFYCRGFLFVLQSTFFSYTILNPHLFLSFEALLFQC